MTRNVHERSTFHFGEWTADLVVLTEGLLGIPAGTTLEDAIELIDARLRLLESGTLGHFRLQAMKRVIEQRQFQLRAEKTLVQIRHIWFNAQLAATVQASFPLNAVRFEHVDNAFTHFFLDAEKSVTFAGSYTFDSWLAGHFLLNAIKQRGRTGSFTLDAETALPFLFTGQLGIERSQPGNIQLGVV